MKPVFFCISTILIVCVGAWQFAVHMPGESYSGAVHPLTPTEIELREHLCRHVAKLAGDIGERNLAHRAALSSAGEYLEHTLAASGYKVERQAVPVDGVSPDRTAYNLVVERPGIRHPEEIVVVGAHYDSAPDTPGADDNASGTAAVLSLARAFATKVPERTVRFVLFANEEPPHFQKPSMGSLVYAHDCKQRHENIVAMLSLETIGYFSDQRGSQQYPFPVNLLYPPTGNFIGFVGNLASRRLVRRAVGSFRDAASVPSEGVAAPAFVTGVDWSDQWSFWEAGYPGIMLTDTALFRNPHYHRASDTPATIDYERLARVVVGLEAVLADLSTAS